jgi:hypothetical protein
MSTINTEYGLIKCANEEFTIANTNIEYKYTKKFISKPVYSTLFQVGYDIDSLNYNYVFVGSEIINFSIADPVINFDVGLYEGGERHLYYAETEKYYIELPSKILLVKI